MRKFVNDPKKFVPEMLKGIVLANPDTLKYVPEYNLIMRSDAPNNNKVSIIQGSGSGHEPAHTMIVGKGMLDAACPGDVFAGPPVEFVYETLYPIFLQRVAPFFVGKDARDLEKLIDGVYLDDSNYKWQGLAFWVCVAAVELAILDLLGKTAKKSVGELFGNVIRREIPVYRASGKRGNSADEEIENLQKMVAETGAKAIKFRLGGRMFYDETTTKRDIALIEKTRQVFGDSMTIYADANGSYDVKQAIKIAKIMEQHKLGFLEEPVPFDHYEETRQIAKSVKIPIAGGECDSSMRQFQWMIENNAVQIVQPDTFYFGGMIRKIRVARMAEAAEIDCTPHMSGYGVGFLHVAHFASVVPNCGAFQEYKGVDKGFPAWSETSSLKAEKGMLKVPTDPGLGISIDADFVKKAEIIKV